MRLLKRLPRETARDYAFRMIKDNIIRLELEPGCLISENELAAELGLSRTPVREALIALSRARVVEITPQKRSIVAPIDETLVEEARFVRDVLECAVVAAPDEIRGQVVKAVIVLTKGTDATDALKKEIQQYVKDRTAPYKYPRIVDEMPKTISGKIIRAKLRS